MWSKLNDNLRFRTAVIAVFAFVWWGVLYPELCFTKETCEQVIIVDGEETEAQQEDYQGILEASGDEVVIKSRFFEWLEQRKSGIK